jgi:hypothetical protein
MPRSTSTRRHRPATPRPRRHAPKPPSLLDLASPPEDATLLDDLVALVALGLLEERRSPEGMVFALTELGRRTPATD